MAATPRPNRTIIRSPWRARSRLDAAAGLFVRLGCAAAPSVDLDETLIATLVMQVVEPLSDS
jgi:hypothetical protein